MEKRVEENKIRRNGKNVKITSLVERLSTIQLGPEQWQVIQEAFDVHLSSDQILPFLREDLTAEEMRQIRDWIVEIVDS